VVSLRSMGSERSTLLCSLSSRDPTSHRYPLTTQLGEIITLSLFPSLSDSFLLLCVLFVLVEEAFVSSSFLNGYTYSAHRGEGAHKDKNERWVHSHSLGFNELSCVCWERKWESERMKMRGRMGTVREKDLLPKVRVRRLRPNCQQETICNMSPNIQREDRDQACSPCSSLCAQI
jgi:hypothetical protein